MRVWYIQCVKTGARWRHNNWGTTDSVPQLFATLKAAQYQTGPKGKASQWWIPEEDRLHKPEIKEAELILDARSKNIMVQLVK